MRTNFIGNRGHRGMAWVFGIAVLAHACAAQPENPSAGACSLSCSNPRVGGAEFAVVPLVSSGDESVTMFCTSDFSKGGVGPTNGPVTVRYKVVETIPPFGAATAPAASSSGSGGAAGGGASSGSASGSGSGSGSTATLPIPGSTLLNSRPVGGVGFTPWVYGLTATEKTADEFKLPQKTADGRTQVSSFQYSGIITPSAEWCSDSCGVITYEFYPECISGKQNVIKAGVMVHGAQTAKSYSFTFTNQ